MREDILRLLDELAADERSRVTTAEVRERFGLSAQAASNLMSRLVAAGFLDRVARGTFVPRPLGQLGTRAASEDITLAVGAAFADEPHRIAFRSALDHHALLTHPARTIQVALPRRVKLSQLSGRSFQPVHESRDTVALGTQQAGHGAMVSTVERTLLDCATRPTLAGGWIVLATALTRAVYDVGQLIQLAHELDATVGLRRLASLTALQGSTALSTAATPPHPRTRLVALDPREPGDGPWTDTRWRVRWPTSPQNASELIAA